MSDRYELTGETRVSEQLESLCRRRVMPFLDAVGVHQKTVPELMMEAYYQGIKDAVLVLKD